MKDIVYVLKYLPPSVLNYIVQLMHSIKKKL